MSKDMIIVAGSIETHPGRREAALAKARSVIAEARRTAGCLDFVVAADPLEQNRLITFERWSSEDALTAFRGGGPDADQAADFKTIEVHDYVARRADD